MSFFKSHIRFFFFRLRLYGLRVLVQRLSGCWDSARRSTSNSYFDKASILNDIFTQTTSLFSFFPYLIFPGCFA
jgi:hypothetical protein